MGDVSSQLWATLLWIMLRVLAATVLAALGGFTLAMLTKSTAATLGVLFSYLLVVETLIQGFRPALQEWLVSTNIRGFLDDGIEYEYEKCVQQVTAERCDWLEKELAFSHSAIFLVVLIAALLLGSWLVFRRRDVN